MALINRISRLVTADFHAVLDQIEEPEQLLKQAIREMEDELVEAEQRISLCSHDQEALAARKAEVESTLAGIGEQLDLCFESGKDDLAKKLIRKQLEARKILKRLDSSFTAIGKSLAEQQATLEENRVTLDGLRQKAELFAKRAPARTYGGSEFDDSAWLARETNVSDDEVEIAFLTEKNARGAT